MSKLRCKYAVCNLAAQNGHAMEAASDVYKRQIPLAPKGIRSGMPSQEASGRDQSAPQSLSVRFGTGFWEGMQRLNAGWSSPVARQAHNLKVIGSNPIPATKIKR